MGYADYYSHGNWDALCDDCGRKFKATDLRKRWDFLMVCSDCYEERHPQDFVRGATDKISVPWSRPEQQDQFVGGYCTPLGSSAVAGNAVAGCMIAGRENPPWMDPGIVSTFTP